MGLDENLFGFIFETAKKRKDKVKTEEEFRKKIKTMDKGFQSAVTEMISDLVIENIDYLADIIVRNDPHKLAAENADILKMLLGNQKARGVIEGAKKQRRFIAWDTKRILEAIAIILSEKGIIFNKDELRWLATNIHRVGEYIYNS